MQKELNSDLENPKTPERFEKSSENTFVRASYNEGESQVHKNVSSNSYSYNRSQVEYQPRSKFQHNPVNQFSSYDGYISLSAAQNSISNPPKFTVQNAEQMMTPERKVLESGGIEDAIYKRNSNIIKSRTTRMSPRRESPRLIENESKESVGKAYPKDYFINKAETKEQHALVDDSFGSPEPKKSKVALTSKAKLTYSIDDLPSFYPEDHIIKNLVKQETKLESFIPPSKVEPVPTNMAFNELSITYQSSPNLISYNYEEAGSPPRCKKSRKNLYHSPTSKRERKEDNDVEYNCNPDNMAAMRANDLH